MKTITDKSLRIGFNSMHKISDSEIVNYIKAGSTLSLYEVMNAIRIDLAWRINRVRMEKAIKNVYGEDIKLEEFFEICKSSKKISDARDVKRFAKESKHHHYHKAFIDNVIFKKDDTGQAGMDEYIMQFKKVIKGNDKADIPPKV